MGLFLFLFELVVEQLADGKTLFGVGPGMALRISDVHRQVAGIFIGIEADHAAQDRPYADAVAELDRAGGADGDGAAADVGVVADALNEGLAVAIHKALDVGHREGGRVVGQGHFDAAAHGAEAGGNDRTDPVVEELQTRELRPGRLAPKQRSQHSQQQRQTPEIQSLTHLSQSRSCHRRSHTCRRRNRTCIRICSRSGRRTRCR